MIEICNAMGIPVVLAPQPSPDLLLKRHRDEIRRADSARFERIEKRIGSLPTSSFRNPTMVAAGYEKMLAAIGKSPQLAAHFVDIQDSVDLDHFIDFIHMDAAGQAMLASAVRPHQPTASSQLVSRRSRRAKRAMAIKWR
jgi:hypothetical protein